MQNPDYFSKCELEGHLDLHLDVREIIFKHLAITNKCNSFAGCYKEFLFLPNGRNCHS